MPLVLTAAVYEPGTWIELSFDRPIDIGAIDGSAITIDDGDMAIRFIGVPGAVLTAPATVRIEVTGFDDWFIPGVTMTATGGNGIVAAGDSAAWSGVTDLPLPFP